MRTLKGKTLLATTTIILLTLISCWFIMADLLKKNMIEETKKELSIQVKLASRLLQDDNGQQGELLEAIATDLQCRITLINSDGTVLMDSDATAENLDNHRLRPEVQGALKNGTATEVRYSRSLGTYLIYSAQKLNTGGETQILRLAYRLSSLKEATREALIRLLMMLVIAAFMALGTGYLMVVHFFHPLERIIYSVDSIAKGEEVQFPLMKDRELKKLSIALDDMYSKLHKTMGELKRERKDLKTLISSMPVGLILLDKSKSPQIVNNAARKLLNLKDSKLLPGEISCFVDQAENIRKSTYITLPERNLYLRATIETVETGILLVLQDLTEERRLVEARRNFIADAGHEFQTPLTSIGITTEFLMETVDGDESTKRYLSSILDQQKRLTSLVDDLLLLSKLESEPPAQKRESYDLAKTIKNIVSEQSKHPLSNSTEIDAQAIPDVAIVWGNQKEVSRAIGNILGNAAKYVNLKFKKRTGGKVSLSLLRQGNSWKLIIADNGMGIKESLASSIFERFNRGDTSRTRQGWGQGGYGLGLAIAKKIVEDQGGKIELTNFSGGATFEVTLPNYK